MSSRKRFLALALSVLGGIICLGAAAEEAAFPAPVRPVIEAPAGEGIIYGQPLSESALIGGLATDPVTGRQVEGYFAWANGDFVPGLGVQQCLCEFVPTGFDTEYFLPVTVRAEVEVGRIPSLVVDPPVCMRHIQYGETVDRAGLTGGVCVDPSGNVISGTWFISDGGRTPAAGRTGAEAVFRPDDGFHYEEARCALEVECDPCTPAVAVRCTQAFPLRPLSEYVLDGWAAGLDGALIPGVFAFRDGARVPDTDAGMYDVTFTPDDGVNFLPVTVKVPVVFGLRSVAVEAVLEVTQGRTVGQGVLIWTAFDEEGLPVAGELKFDERVLGLPALDGEYIGAVFTPLNAALYSEIPVSVRVTAK